jgi:LmbE family N-acetylglucosaminyl deacetylase
MLPVMSWLPDLGQARRLLCVQPHYDDNDLGAGGTIATLASRGAEVFYLTATDDLVGVHDTRLSDEEATRVLREEQHKAGLELGVTQQFWLGLPDAGEYDYFDLRRSIIEHIRRLRPDFVFSVDPWLPNEAHRDHLMVGRAVAEASFLQGMPRLRTRPEVDRGYEPYGLDGVVFYFTRDANLVFDIEPGRERKHRAIRAYRAQFSAEELELVSLGLGAKEQQWAAAEPFSHGEALKLLTPGELHVGLG